MVDGFSDEKNDAVLFMGWLDYQLLTKRVPVEVQVFRVWWYATNENHLKPEVDPMLYRKFFPDIMKYDRSEQKRRLKRATEKYKDNREILADARTEIDPLVIDA